MLALQKVGANCIVWTICTSTDPFLSYTSGFYSFNVYTCPICIEDVINHCEPECVVCEMIYVLLLATTNTAHNSDLGIFWLRYAFL